VGSNPTLSATETKERGLAPRFSFQRLERGVWPNPPSTIRQDCRIGRAQRAPSDGEGRGLGLGLGLGMARVHPACLKGCSQRLKVKFEQPSPEGMFNRARRATACRVCSRLRERLRQRRRVVTGATVVGLLRFSVSLQLPITLRGTPAECYPAQDLIRGGQVRPP
jgi:hypothetical protein